MSDARDQLQRLGALMKAFKSNDASSLEVCNFARDIDFDALASARPEALRSGDGMSAGRFHCACVFSRPTDFSEAVLVSECAYHSARSVERRVLKEVSDDLHIHGHGLAVARVERMIHLLPLARSQEKPDA